MAKNGLPPVFWCTSRASGALRSDSQRRASAINCVRCSRPSGPSVISSILPPAGLLASSLRLSGFVVAVGADEEKIAEFGSAQQVFQEVERRRVEPLQVIEEKRQRMFRPSEDADKLSEHQLEAPLRVLWRKLRNRRRFSDDELHF